MNITMKRGDTPTLEIVVSFEDGRLDLTDKTLTFTAKKDLSFPDSLALFQKSTSNGITVTDAEYGVAEIQLVSQDTSGLSAMTHRFHYDVQLTSGSTVYTIVSGILTVEPDVTESA